MIDREIRAMLRGATASGILTGWQGPHTRERSYCICPSMGDAAERPLGYVIRYCEMLREAGVAPRYRRSEPASFGYPAP